MMMNEKWLVLERYRESGFGKRFSIYHGLGLAYVNTHVDLETQFRLQRGEDPETGIYPEDSVLSPGPRSSNIATVFLSMTPAVTTVSELVGALSPVNHEGLYQGRWRLL